MKTNREQDAEIAVKVFGWTWRRVERLFEPPRGREQWRCLSDGEFYAKFPLADMSEPIYESYGLHPKEFTTDVAADYTVLLKVRETWDRSMQRKFEQFLFEILSRTNIDRCYVSRCGPAWLYLPGDYSRAALAALSAGKAGEK